MTRSRIAALGGLALVAALIVGLVVTNGDDDADTTTATATATATSSASTTLAEAPAATDPVDTAPEDPTVPDLADRGPHLPLLEIDGWLQSDVESLEELRGKVVAVQFWTFGCVNCRNTMQQNVALYEKYDRDDFEIVGVHAPEFDFERDPDRILEAAAEQNITWPIVLDTEKRTFHSWQEGRRGFWPRVYLLDREGNVRYDHIGEYGSNGFEELDAAVGALIAEP